MNDKNIIANRLAEISSQYHDELDTLVAELECKYDKLFNILYNDCAMMTGHNFYKVDARLQICKYCDYDEEIRRV